MYFVIDEKRYLCTNIPRENKKYLDSNIISEWEKIFGYPSYENEYLQFNIFFA